MKQNIFAQAVPTTVELPFATVSFMPEPVASDITSLNDLPNVVFDYIDSLTSLVHTFYLKVERKTDFNVDYDGKRAAELLCDKVQESICAFGNRDANHPMSLEPKYPFYCYEGVGHATKLRPNADITFMQSLVGHGMPAEPPSDADADIHLSLSAKGAGLIVNLANDVTVTIENFQPGGRRQNNVTVDPTIIIGDAILFGMRASVTVQSCGGFWMGSAARRELAHWIPAKVLRDAITETIAKHVGENFGPFGSDAFLVSMLRDINFTNLAAKAPAMPESA